MDNLFHRIGGKFRTVLGRYARMYKIQKLKKVGLSTVSLTRLFTGISLPLTRLPSSQQRIFGFDVPLDESIHWHKDYINEYEFPGGEYFTQIDLDVHFNRGADIKFPWELSRLYFTSTLASDYVNNGCQDSFERWKVLIIDWDVKNPYLHGINWISPMEVGIRVSNLALGVSVFFEAINRDSDFHFRCSRMIEEHAYYLSALPEVFKKGHSTNHTVANMTGLLFAATALSKHPETSKWRSQAMEGLEEYMRYQVNDEGVHFEKSIPYHGLVLEFFSWCALLCRSNGLRFSSEYYSRLHSMFLYTAAYVDAKGNSPLLGDNDSGCLFYFGQTEVPNHSGLLKLHELIFEFDLCPWLKKSTEGMGLGINSKQLTEKNTGKVSLKYEKRYFESGIFIWRTETISLLAAIQKIGMGGQGGHNHMDVGSITLSIHGNPCIVDAGTYTYTANYEERNLYRSINMHNVAVTSRDSQIDYFPSLWAAKMFPNVDHVECYSDGLTFRTSNIFNEFKFRDIRVTPDTLRITDKISGDFETRFHLHPDCKPSSDDIRALDFGDFQIQLSVRNFRMEEYDYCPHYLKKRKALRIVVSATNELTTHIIFK